MATTYINPFVFAGEELGGMVLLTPTSIAYTGTSASIGTNGSVEFTAVSSLSLNGVFSADYDNYMVTVRHSNSVNNQDCAVRLRASGTDNSTASSYTRQLLYATGTSVGAVRTSDNSALVMPTDNVWRNGTTIYMFGPNLAQPTAGRSLNVRSIDNAYLIDFAWTHNQSVAYDGFTFGPTSGGISGLVSVYGLVGA